MSIRDRLAAKAKANAAKAKEVEVDEVESGEDEEEEEVVKPAPKGRGRPAAKAKAPEPEDDDEVEDEDEEEAEEEEAPAPKSKKGTPTPTKGRGRPAKVVEPDDDDEVEDEDEEEEVVKPAPKGRGRPAKVVEPEEEEEDEEEEAPAPKSKKAAPAAPVKGRGRPAKVVEPEEDEEEEAPAPKSKKAAFLKDKKGTPAKKTYAEGTWLPRDEFLNRIQDKLAGTSFEGITKAQLDEFIHAYEDTTLEILASNDVTLFGKKTKSTLIQPRLYNPGVGGLAGVATQYHTEVNGHRRVTISIPFDKQRRIGTVNPKGEFVEGKFDGKKFIAGKWKDDETFVPNKK